MQQLMRLIIGESDQVQYRLVMPVALEAKAKTRELRMLLVCRHILEKSKPQKIYKQLNAGRSEYKAIANSIVRARNTETLGCVAWLECGAGAASQLTACPGLHPLSWVHVRWSCKFSMSIVHVKDKRQNSKNNQGEIPNKQCQRHNKVRVTLHYLSPCQRSSCSRTQRGIAWYRQNVKSVTHFI